MAVSFDSAGIRNAADDLRAEFDDIDRGIPQAIGRGGVRTLQTAPTNLGLKGWRLTGRQQRSFGFRVASRRAIFTNAARNPRDGFAYPALNESKFGVVTRVLNRFKAKWLLYTREELDRG